MTLRILTAVALLYSALHFASSGIRQPFDHPNLGKFDEHAARCANTSAPAHPSTARTPRSTGRSFSSSFIELTGWRRTTVTVLGDAVVLAAMAVVTWTWIRTGRTRSRDRTLWEMVGANTTFEYATLALGAVSYALVAIVSGRRWDRITGATFLTSLLLLGGIVPRQWLNRLTMIDLLNRWTGYVHLAPSEAYQYYGFPMVGLALLVVALWRLPPAAEDR